MTPSDVARCVVAYEPIWAIGTGNADTPRQRERRDGRDSRVRRRHSSSVRILYGGSMKPDNVAALRRAAEHRRRAHRRR